MIFLSIHIVLCLVYLTICHREKNQIDKDVPSLIVYMLPCFGFLMWIVDRHMRRTFYFGIKEIELEKLKVTETKYRHLDTDESAVNHATVPLEDALVVNDEKLRRSLLLDILHKNPEEYLSVLTRAKASDDVEITHYATTTLLEIQREYEQKLQEFVGEYTSRKRDELFLQEYVNCLHHYVESGLIDGSVLQMQQEQLLKVLEDALQLDRKSRENLFLYIETAMELKKYEEAQKWILDSQGDWEKMEEWNQLAVRFFWETGQPEKINEILEQVEKSNIYLSKEGKEWFQFWSQGKSYGEIKGQ